MSRRRVFVILALAALAIGVAVLWHRRDVVPASSTTATSERERAAKIERGSAGDLPLAWYARGARRRIAGIVLDDTKPVAGATVRLASRLVMAGVMPELRVVSDAHGKFEFPPQLPLAYVVSAELAQRTTAFATIDLRSPAPSEDMHLVLHACDASLHGTIRDAAGGVIPGARITRATGEVSTSAGVEADDAGKYDLCVPVGTSIVAVNADGYAEVIDNLPAYGPVQRDFALVPEASIAGRVVLARDRSAVAHAVVELRPMERDRPMRPRFATTDDTGAFHFAGAAPGPYALLAKADGLVSLRPTHVIAETDATEEIVCVVGESITIAGTVVEQGTKKPVAGSQVYLRATAIEYDPMLSYHYATTQPDGTFTFEHVLPGTYAPSIANSDLADDTKSIVVTTANVSDVVLQVDRGGSISGRVTSRGKPVDGARVMAQAARTTRIALTDHAGAFELTGLVDGTYQVYAESQRVGAFTKNIAIAIANGERKTGVAIDLDLAGSIAGVVVDQNDAPVAGVVLRLSLLGGRDFGVATTASDGSFKAAALSGGGEYAYEVRPDEGSQVTLRPVGRKRFSPIAVANGTTEITGLRVRVQREDFTIAGRVLDAEGKPAAGVSLAVHPTTAHELTLTDANGAFAIRGLPAGTYNVLAKTARGEAHEADVKAGRTDVVLRFKPMGTIEGTLEGFGEEADVIATGTGRFRITAGNSFRLRDVPPGIYQVTAKSKAGAAIERVEVAAGATAKVVLRPRGFGSIAGTYTDEVTHAPIANARCDLYTGLGDRKNTKTDASGTFRFERVMAEKVYVDCGTTNESVTVVANEEARVAVVRRPSKTPPRAYAGLTLEVHLGELRVQTVAPNGPAAKAKVAVGDVIIAVDGNAVRYPEPEFVMGLLEEREPGIVKLRIDRDETQLELSVTLDRAP